MALKYKLTEEEHSKLSKDMKSEYKKDGDSYVLDVEGGEDTGALKRAKDHEKAQRVEAEKKAKELKEQMDTLTEQIEELRAAQEKGSKKGDSDAIAALERSWKEKLSKREKELTDASEKLTKLLQGQLVDGVALKMASELAGENAEILLPHIKSRLAAEIKDGAAATKVLGADGLPSASSLEDLQKEFLSSPKFATVVVASKASGGSAGGRKGSGGAAKALKDMTATEEAKFANEKPEEYKAMLAREGAPKQ